MRPMTLYERGVADPSVSVRRLLSGAVAPLRGDSSVTLTDYVEEICASGFPGMRSLSARALRFQLDSYLRNAVDRDVAEQGLVVRRPDAMMAWLRAYAAATSSTTSYTQILDVATPGESEKPARSTANSYRDALAALWLLDPVPAWSPTGSRMSRLGASPKHHLADPALAVRLLGLSVSALLDGAGKPLSTATGGMLGPLFESLATLCLSVPAQAAEAEVFHLRTRNGDHEVDLIVVRPDGRFVAIEVKLAGTVEERDGKHLRWLREQAGGRMLDAIIINTGPHAYRRPDGIGVVPLSLLAP